MNAIVALPYGLDQSQKDADQIVARELEEKLFSLLSETLNEYHCTTHDGRFWRIVLGHWLRRFVDVILNRVKTLEQCLQSHQLNGITVCCSEHYSLATLDSNEAVWAFNDDKWNNVLNVRILSLLDAISVQVEVIAEEESEGFRLLAVEPKASLRSKLLRRGYQQLGKLAGKLASDNDAYIINSYLPRKEEIKLHLALGQVPQFFTFPKLELRKRPDSALRQNLTNQIAGATNNALFEIMCQLVFELIPVCYLEGYTDFTNKIYELPLPKKPKFIFTSNNFDTDELFKVWVAHKVETGVRYIVGQHGSNYGTSRYMHPSIEESTSDKFLTWGWSDGMQQHAPTFIFKTAGCKVGAYNPNGGLLLIELHEHRRITTWDGTYEFCNYFKEQQEFINGLEETIRNNLTIRLPYVHIDLKWNEAARWREFDELIRIDYGNSHIGKLISKSRLIIHSYDSTGILETLSQNIPTLAFWQKDFEHLRDSAKPFYKLLLDSGILHLTAESAAAKINEIWDDVEGWWSQTTVQEARRIFSNRYARASESPIQELLKNLHQ